MRVRGSLTDQSFPAKETQLSKLDTTAITKMRVVAVCNHTHTTQTKLKPPSPPQEGTLEAHEARTQNGPYASAFVPSV
jgi:hypothetical protein